MKPKTIAVAAIAIIVIAVGVTLAVWYSSRPASAEDAAQSYLTALSEGDVAGIRNALLDPSVYPDEAYDALAAAAARIEFDGVDVTETDESALGSASVSISGQSYELPLHLVADGAGWKVDAEPAEPVTITVTDSVGFTLGDDAFTTTDGTSEPLVFLPGAYTVVAEPADLIAGEVQFTAGVPGAEAPKELIGALRPEAADALQSAIDAHLDACVTPATVVPEACGFTVPWAADIAQVREVTFRVDAEPTIELSVEEGSFSTTAPGSLVATITGVLRSGVDGEVSYRTDDWSPRGVIAIEATGVQLRMF